MSTVHLQERLHGMGMRGVCGSLTTVVSGDIRKVTCALCLKVVNAARRMIQKPKKRFRVMATYVVNKVVGTFEAYSEEDAIRKADDFVGDTLNLCHQCDREVGGDLTQTGSLEAEEIE